MSSSSSDGFFQDPPVIPNQYADDAALRCALQLFLPASTRRAIRPDLDHLSSLVLSPAVQTHLASAEQHLPTLQTWDTFGRRVDRLLTSEGWRALQAIGQREGIVAIGHDEKHGSHRRLYQHFKYLIWSPSSAITTCPAAMTDGAAALLTRLLRNPERAGVSASTVPILEEAKRRLVSRDPSYAWTSGQWMTERAGGSDVSNTETRATLAPKTFPYGAPAAIASDGKPLGPWRIDGFKWFSSATDADMTVLLAKTGTSDELSLFFAPTRLRVPTASTSGISSESDQTVYNGIHPQRLKSKMGTRALPTAELVLTNMRAHMLGPPGQGTREVATVLNITRIHNAVSAVASWGRGLAIARAFAKVRKVGGGKLLMNVPAHVRGLAQLSVDYRANILFTFFVVNLLGITEDAEAGVPTIASSTTSPPPEIAAQLLRLLTPVVKATTAISSITALRSCIEALGGIGYLEDPADPLLNVSRLFRDANVLAIWEGTTDVLGADVVRVLVSTKGQVLEVVEKWVKSVTKAWKAQWAIEAGEAITLRLIVLKNSITRTLAKGKDGASELLYRARNIMNSLAWVVAGVLLVESALCDQRRGEGTVAGEIARRWVYKHATTDNLQPDAGEEEGVVRQNTRSWEEEATWDRRIVFEGHHDYEELDNSKTVSNAARL